MKRFWQAVDITAEAAGFGIALDDRPVRTPARAPLLLPNHSLAQAIAAEWRAVEEHVNPRAMPLTGLANAAIDRVAPDPATFAGHLSHFGESDLLYYRAEGPRSLVDRQAAQWDPLLAWAANRYNVTFNTVAGVMHRAQPKATLARLKAATAARGAFELAGLHPLVTITGSLLIALALADGAIGRDEAWEAAELDELWQAEHWGEDALALETRVARRRDYDAAARFLGLL